SRRFAGHAAGAPAVRYARLGAFAREPRRGDRRGAGREAHAGPRPTPAGRDQRDDPVLSRARPQALAADSGAAARVQLGPRPVLLVAGGAGTRVPRSVVSTLRRA